MNPRTYHGNVTPGGDAVAYTGSGGGGSGRGNPYNRGGIGSSGIVIIRYLGTVQRASGGAISIVGGYTVHTFTVNGTWMAY